MSNRNQADVIDAGDLRKYRTEIPNIIDDMGLSVYAFRLYAHLKRVAGDSGKCYQGKRKMAEVCGMSPAMIPNAKRELVDHGLIQITPGDAKTQTADLIVIVDIWRQNFSTFVKSDPGHTVTTPSHDVTTPGHTVDGAGHTVDPKNKPSKNKPIKKEPSEESSPPAAGDDGNAAQALIAELRNRQFAYIDHDPKRIADNLINEFGVEKCLVALETTAIKHKAQILSGQRGIQAPLAYMRSVLSNSGGNGYTPPKSKVRQSMDAFDEFERMVAEKGISLP